MANEEANEQAWIDFKKIITTLAVLDSNKSIMISKIENLEELKTEVFDDQERKDELKLIIETHPAYEMASLANKVNGYIDLKTCLEE